jgi:nicotinamide-nucleotide amidase
MKVEVITVGNDLLLSDVINTMAAYVTRKLHEVRVGLTCRLTVGEDVALLTDVLQTAVSRADVVIVVGGLNEEQQYVTLRALATIVGHPFDNQQMAPPAAQRLGSSDVELNGWLLETENGVFFCLPRQRPELAYLLDAQVLPWLRQQMPAERVSAWAMLRTVGLMESNLRERLADVAAGENSRILLDSFAGQTNVRLWAEGSSDQKVTAELSRLKELISQRLGDYIYGSETDRLEQVIVRLLRQSDVRLVLAECNTGRVLARLLEPADEENGRIRAIPTYDAAQLADYLNSPNLPTESDLIQWCRGVAEQLLQQSDAALGLVVYNHLTPGGIQMLITLASPMGVSVTQRSFSGRPENIDQWVCSLSLAHVRRWLLVHGRP